LEEVEEDVGAELGELGDGAGDGGDPLGWEVESQQVGGAVGVWFGDHSPVYHGVTVAVCGLLGVDLDAVAPEVGGELSRGEPGGVLEDLVDDGAGGGDGQVGGASNHDPGPAGVDVSGGEEFQDPGESPVQVQGQAQFVVRRPAGQPESGPDFSGRGLGGDGGVVVDVRERV
jgi:hypothetical protein